MVSRAAVWALANDGHDTRALQAYLGHKNIQHTVRYIEMSPARFKDFCAKTVENLILAYLPHASTLARRISEQTSCTQAPRG